MAQTFLTGSHSANRILIADEDPSIRLLCVTSLIKAGYHVLEAEGNSEAMSLYASAPPIDLVLTDLFLPPPEFQLHSDHNRYPRVNGHDPVRQLLSLKKEARVLFMSSHTLGNLSSQGINIIPERFLHKPFTAQQLLEQVATALAAPPIHRSTSPAIRPTNGIRWVN